MDKNTRKGDKASPGKFRKSSHDAKSSGNRKSPPRIDSFEGNSKREDGFKERSEKKRFTPSEGNPFRRDRKEGNFNREGAGESRPDRGEGFRKREGGSGGGYRGNREGGDRGSFRPRPEGNREGGGFRGNREGGESRPERTEGFRPRREGGSGGGYRGNREGGDRGSFRPRPEGNREGGGFRGNREGGESRPERTEGFRPRREGGSGGGYRGNREGGDRGSFRPRPEGNREGGGFRGNREGGESRPERTEGFRPRREGGSGGGYRGNREGGDRGSFRPRPEGNREGGGFRGNREGGESRPDRTEGFRPRREGGSGGGYRGNREGGDRGSFRPRPEGNREGGGFRGNREGGESRPERTEGFRPRREGGSSGGYRGNREGGERGSFRPRPEGGGFRNREGGSGGGYRGNREGGDRGNFRPSRNQDGSSDRNENFGNREGGNERPSYSESRGRRPSFPRSREGFGNRDRGEGNSFSRDSEAPKKKVVLRKDARERVESMEQNEKKTMFQDLEEKKSPFLDKNNLAAMDESDEDLDKPIRINRFLAKCGLGARRNVEEFIQKGRVSINGVVIESFSVKVKPLEDKVTFDGEEIQLLPDSMIIAFNKPYGYLCSHHDVHHEKTVFNLLPAKYRKFNMAGRLDLTSRGLMILSPNGELLNNITHPSSGLEKEYMVKIDNVPSENEIVKKFLQGIDDDGEFLRAKEVEMIDSGEGIVRIVLKEGKKRQIHRMFTAVGSKVLDLQRVRIGRLNLSSLDLEEGSFKEIKEENIFGE
jgi:23S rRNA pseudouridine2605 synthase